MRFIIIIAALLVGFGGGGAAAYLLQPHDTAVVPEEVVAQPESEASFADLPTQFVVPITRDGSLVGVVAASLAVQLRPGQEAGFDAMEPRLRDAYLDVLFRHAAAGGFDGDFTTGQAMNDLRRALDQVTQTRLSDVAERVLITSLARQDY